MLVLGRYRYNQYYVNTGPATRWLCSRYSRKSLVPVFAESRRGAPVIYLGPHRFNKRKQGPNSRVAHTQWRCVKWSSGCRASILTLDGSVIKTMNQHQHHD
ncbi:FLYWCH zinc finger domain-containing protein [Phthorimaea operculella]|nr:FLYWCH zinc finger domain-containing protein [Phthorimaea operculella]